MKVATAHPDGYHGGMTTALADPAGQNAFLRRTLLSVSMFLCCAILFSLFTVFCQVTDLSLAYLETSQVHRHVRVLEGHGGNPYQYRILSEYLVEWVILALKALGSANPTVVGFILCRVVQNIAIFALAALYYRMLGLDSYATVLGLSLLAWGMTHSGYDADLTFNSYSDVIFYLVAAVVILGRRPIWLIPVVGLAALNRETSGLIPFMLIAHSFYTIESRRLLGKHVLIATAALAVYVILFVGLKYAYGEQPLVLPYGHRLGFDLFRYNISRYTTWVQLFGTLGVLPVLAVVSARRWPPSLTPFFWSVVPIWVLVHLLAAVMAEARLFLVPLTLIFVPGALFGLVSFRREDASALPRLA
jgi:hypothetical protein